MQLGGRKRLRPRTFASESLREEAALNRRGDRHDSRALLVRQLGRLSEEWGDGPSSGVFCERVGISETELRQSKLLVSSISRPVTPLSQERKFATGVTALQAKSIEWPTLLQTARRVWHPSLSDSARSQSRVPRRDHEMQK